MAENYNCKNNIARNVLTKAVTFSLGIIILAFMLSYVGVGDFIRALQRVSPYWFIIALIILPVPFLIRAWRWRTLLLPTKNGIRYSNALGATFIGSLTNEIIPIRAGEILRTYLMKSWEKVSFFGTFSSIIIERILDLLMIITLATTMLFLLPQSFILPEWIINSLKVVGSLTISALLFLIIGTKKEDLLIKLANNTLFRIPIPKGWKPRLNTWLEELIRGVKTLHYSYKSIPILLAKTFAIWFAYGLHTYAIFQMFGINIPLLVALLGSMLFNLSSILPAPPGRVGSYEAFWSIIFVGLGFPLEMVLPIGIMKHLLSTSMISIGGCASMFSFSLNLRDLTSQSKWRFMSQHG